MVWVRTRWLVAFAGVLSLTERESCLDVHLMSKRLAFLAFLLVACSAGKSFKYIVFLPASDHKSSKLIELSRAFVSISLFLWLIVPTVDRILLQINISATPRADWVLSCGLWW